jgi:hypothetical protein
MKLTPSGFLSRNFSLDNGGREGERERKRERKRERIKVERKTKNAGTGKGHCSLIVLRFTYKKPQIAQSSPIDLETLRRNSFSFGSIIGVSV